MKNETLKIDLCSRLSYGFMCKDDEDENKWVALIPMAIDEVSVKDAIVYEYKPILFNSLTEPITINGETFTPIERLASLTIQGDVKNVMRLMENAYLFWPQWIIEKLNEWHVNYRLSEDQFIPATNEYA